MVGDVGDVLGYAGAASELGSEFVRGYRNVRSGMPMDDAIVNGVGRFGTDALARQGGKLGGAALGGLVTENPVGAALGGVFGEGTGSLLADQLGITDAGGAAALRGWRALKADVETDPRVLQAWQQLLAGYPGP